jgi:hypothetical protein
MSGPNHLQMALLAGARELLAAHARELPQRDDLCGAFCGALALQAAGVIATRDGQALDQDTVALAAGSVVSPARDAGTLPHGEGGRRDYRLALPSIEDSALSGTTAAGLLAAIDALAGGALAVTPCSGPWNARTLAGLFDLCESLEEPVTLVANLATRYLWGGHPTTGELLAYLLDGERSAGGPPADWDVGHFAAAAGASRRGARASRHARGGCARRERRRRRRPRSRVRA